MTNPEPHATHRELELLESLRGFGGSARTSNLADALGVSEETVRRTVKALAKSGLVQRVHGGVYLSNSEAQSPVLSRLGKRTEEKLRIARAAARMIPDRSAVFLDVGSTSAYVAQALAARGGLTILTNSLHVAQTLLHASGNRVFFAGGELRMVESGVFGTDTLAYVTRFNIDTAILSIDGFNNRTGFLLAGSEEADLARSVAARARRTVIVADHTKFGQSAPFVACDPASVDAVITDRPPGKKFADRLAEMEIELVVTPQDAEG